MERNQAPDKKVSWLGEWSEHKPVEDTASSVLAWPMWTDPPGGDKNFSPKFNEEDGHVERRSQNGLYEVEMADLEIPHVGRCWSAEGF